MEITKFDVLTLGALRARIDEVLDTVSEEFGVSIEQGTCRFSGRQARLKLVMTTKSESGEYQDAAEVDFRVLCDNYGLREEDFGKKFSCSGKVYTICGLKASARKYPIIARNAQGKSYKFSAQLVKDALGSS